MASSSGLRGPQQLGPQSNYQLFIPELVQESVSSACDYSDAKENFQNNFIGDGELLARAIFLDHSKVHLSEQLGKQVHVINELWFYILPFLFCAGTEKIGWKGFTLPFFEKIVVLTKRPEVAWGDLRREYTLLSSFPKHEGIIYPLALEEKLGNIYLYVKQYSLDGYASWEQTNLFQRTGKPSHDLFVLKNIQTVLRQLISGLSFLQDNHIIHGDIKPENALMLFDTQNPEIVSEAVWTDFSFAFKIEELKFREIARGSFSYISPELALARSLQDIVKANSYTKDIWALGIAFGVIFQKEISPSFIQPIINVCFDCRMSLERNGKERLQRISDLCSPQPINIHSRESWIDKQQYRPNSLESFLQGFLQIDPSKRTPLNVALQNIEKIELVPKK